MRIGIDMGGTKTEIICLDAHNGKELYRQRVPSPQNDYAGTVKTLASLVRTAESTLNQKGTVGIGIPGTISSGTGRVKNANATWLNGSFLKKDLEAELGRQVRIENDANCLAVSEATDGAAAGKGIVFGVIIGTGCGAGVVVNGKSILGINGIGGEWGHNPLPLPRVFHEDADKLMKFFDGDEDVSKIINPTYAHHASPQYFTNDWAENEFPGTQCYCGKRNCLETWISGTGFKKEYARVNGESISTHDIIANADQGEPKAVAALNRYMDRLARALAGVINILDPDTIVLGGGMGNVKQLYTEVPKIWDKYVFSDTCETELLAPRYGDSSGVRGAAWLWEKDSQARAA